MGLLVLVPISDSLASEYYPVALAYLAVAINCAQFYSICRRIEHVQQLQRNETLAVAAFIFINSSLLFTLPMLFVSSHENVPELPKCLGLDS